MPPNDLRNLIQGVFRQFTPGFAFVWTIICGMLIGMVILVEPARDGSTTSDPMKLMAGYFSESKSAAILIFSLLGAMPWIPLVLENISRTVTDEMASSGVAYHRDFHRATKLLNERRIWEAVEEFELLQKEMPDDPELQFQIAEVYWIGLGDAKEGLRRYGRIWSRIQKPDTPLLGDHTFFSERPLPVALRMADIHYLSRDFQGAKRVLENLVASRGRNLGDARESVLDRIETLKALGTTRPEILVLFDIDGTLCLTGGAGGGAVGAAFEEVYGKPADIAKIDFRGRTDISLWRELLSNQGMSYSPDDPYLSAFKDSYLVHLRRLLTRSNPKPTLGAAPLLERLEREPGVAMGLLTGNIEMGGRIKLQSIRLNRFFPVGGFGEDGEDRSDIAAAAIDRAQRYYGANFSPDHIYVVGDAAADIEAARSAGAKSIAVGTGWTSKEELVGMGPDLYMDDFRQSTIFLGRLGIKEPTGHRLSINPT